MAQNERSEAAELLGTVAKVTVKFAYTAGGTAIGHPYAGALAGELAGEGAKRLVEDIVDGR
ncbi:hypothetical protein [Rhizohabitans arisaemae]|uniref:hypothetical protein n=1 Tax=Rhizohabitans arisaemae TaxID=2720610 RepID=UPI0024B19F0E|nr:hypothetical protein [Rhizohabitans arisaemae]